MSGKCRYGSGVGVVNGIRSVSDKKSMLVEKPVQYRRWRNGENGAKNNNERTYQARMSPRPYPAGATANRASNLTPTSRSVQVQSRYTSTRSGMRCAQNAVECPRRPRVGKGHAGAYAIEKRRVALLWSCRNASAKVPPAVDKPCVGMREYGVVKQKASWRWWEKVRNV